MSQYANFYLRRGECFIPIGSFSRNNVIYESVYDYTKKFEKVNPLTKVELTAILTRLNEAKKVQKRHKKTAKRNCMVIIQSPVTIAEKQDLMAQYEETAAIIKEDIGYIDYAIGYFNSLVDMVDNAKYSDILNADEFLYVGIETPENITGEDIYEG